MKKKEFKNIIYSFFGQIVILFFGFLVPRIILQKYGSDTNGLTNTITQVFTYLALLEAGIAQATTNSLYKYLHDKKINDSNISKIMSISQAYFRNVSKVYGLIVLLLSFVLPLFLKTNLPYYVVCLYVLFEGLIALVSFYFIQSWNALLTADGKNYLIIKVDLFTKVSCYLVKILLALKGWNIIYIQIGCFIVSLIKLFIYKKMILKEYNWISITKTDKSDKLENKSAYLISEIAWTVFSSTDMIILSIFCSTKFASIYSIYNMVFLAINSLLNSVYNSLRYILGKSFFNDKEEYMKIHDVFNSIFLGAMTIFMCVTVIMIMPFIRIYTKGINDINYIYFSFPILFSLIQMLSWSRYVSGNLTAIAGYAKNTSYASIIEAILNLTLSVILVNKFGIIGVLIATVCALPLKVIYCTYLSDKIILKRSCWFSIKTLVANWLIYIATILIYSVKHLEITSLLEFVVYGFLLTIIYTIIILFVNCIINKNILLYVKKINIKKMGG